MEITASEMEINIGRGLLTQAIRLRNIKGVLDRFPQIRVIALPEDRPVGEICLTYVFGQATSPSDEIQRVIETSEEIQSGEIQEGDIVVYFDGYGDWRHVGRGMQKGSVVSKWGDQEVVEHPAHLVPSVYGQPKVFRDI